MDETVNKPRDGTSKNPYHWQKDYRINLVRGQHVDYYGSLCEVIAVSVPIERLEGKRIDARGVTLKDINTGQKFDVPTALRVNRRRVSN